MEKKSFILHSDQIEIFESLNNDDAGKLIKAIYRYANYGKIDNLSGLLKVVFIPFKTGIDRNGEKYEKVCERNRQNIEKRWNNKDTTGKSGIPLNTKNTDSDTKSKSDTNTDSDTDTNTDTKSDSKTTMSSKLDGGVVLVLDFMNKLGNRDFKNVKSNMDLIKSKLDDGFTIEDCKDVIYHQHKEFVKRKLKPGDKDLSKYYRPSTLFGENFESYLQDYKQYNDRDVK